MSQIYGIIAGNGLLPISLVDIFTKQGKDCYIAALEGEANPILYKNYSCRFFKIGMVGSIINYFQEYNVRDIVIVGGVKRPNLQSIKVDLVGSRLIARILKQKFLGDDTILTIIIKFLEEYGFNIISNFNIINMDNKLTTKTRPSKGDLVDIELGVKLLDSIGDIDVGQSVIVEDGYIIGIEAAEGTDNLIKRCAALRKKSTGGVLVKMMKNTQDIRIDLPTIGPETINNLAACKYNGLAIQKDKVIIIKPKVTYELADKYRIFIIEK